VIVAPLPSPARTHTHTHIHTFIHIHTRTHTHTSVHTHSHIHTHSLIHLVNRQSLSCRVNRYGTPWFARIAVMFNEKQRKPQKITFNRLISSKSAYIFVLLMRICPNTFDKLLSLSERRYLCLKREIGHFAVVGVVSRATSSETDRSELTERLHFRRGIVICFWCEKGVWRYESLKCLVSHGEGGREDDRTYFWFCGTLYIAQFAVFFENTEKLHIRGFKWIWVIKIGK